MPSHFHIHPYGKITSSSPLVTAQRETLTWQDPALHRVEGTYERGNPNKYLPLDLDPQPPAAVSQLALQSRARREPRLEGHASRRRIIIMTLWTLHVFSIYPPHGSPTKLYSFMAAKCLWHEHLEERDWEVSDNSPVATGVAFRQWREKKENRLIKEMLNHKGGGVRGRWASKTCKIHVQPFIWDQDRKQREKP